MFRKLLSKLILRRKKKNRKQPQYNVLRCQRRFTIGAGSREFGEAKSALAIIAYLKISVTFILK